MRALAPVAVEQFVGGRPNRAAVLRERSGCLVACEAHPDELLERIATIEIIEIIEIIKREHLESSRSLSGPSKAPLGTSEDPLGTSEAPLGIPFRRPFPRSPARPSS